jgi:hypothetical protein
VDAARQLAELAEGLVQLGADAGQLMVDVAQLRRDGRRGGPQPQGEGDQALLGPVMQVALDPASGLVGGGDDAGA